MVSNDSKRRNERAFDKEVEAYDVPEGGRVFHRVGEAKSSQKTLIWK